LLQVMLLHRRKIHRQMMNTRYYPWNEVAHLFITGSRALGDHFDLSSSLCLSRLPLLSIYLSPSLSPSPFLASSHSNDVLDPDFSRGSRSPRGKYTRANVALSEITHLTRSLTRRFLSNFKRNMNKVPNRKSYL